MQLLRHSSPTNFTQALLLNSMRKDHNETRVDEHLLAHVRIITTQYQDGLFPYNKDGEGKIKNASTIVVAAPKQ